MASENATVVLGIPIPSTDPVFLAIVGIHVLFGLAVVASGGAAMVFPNNPQTYGGDGAGMNFPY